MESTKLGRLAIKLAKLSSSIGEKIKEPNNTHSFFNIFSAYVQLFRLTVFPFLLGTSFLLTIIASLYVNIVRKD